MKCPRCGTELSPEIFDPDAEWDFCGKCPLCQKEITNNDIRRFMEPSDCLCVRTGDISAEDFDEDCCQDCHEACSLANQESDIELVQDEEGNWCYQEDLAHY